MKPHGVTGLAAFFALSCGIMVLCTIDPLQIVARLPSRKGADILAAWSPNLSAFIVICLGAGLPGLRKWASDWGRCRAGTGWYLAALSPLAIAFIEPGVFALVGGKMKPVRVPYWPDLLGQLAWISVLGASGEEGGWRGFAQPLLQRRMNVHTASIVVGFMWAAWHFPAFSVEGLVDTSRPFWELTVWLVANAVLVGWIWNGTGGSTLLAALYHFSFNASWPLANAVLHQATAGSGHGLVSGAVYLAYASAVVWITSRPTAQTPVMRECETNRSAPQRHETQADPAKKRHSVPATTDHGVTRIR